MNALSLASDLEELSGTRRPARTGRRSATRTLRLYLAMPIRCDEADDPALVCSRAVRRLSDLLRSCPADAVVVAAGLFVNGPGAGRHAPASACLPGVEVDVCFDPTPGKIPAVNRALQAARRADCALLVCVDDDIVIPSGGLSRLLDEHRACAVSGMVAAAKAPLVHAESTPFQRLYSYAVQASFRYDLYPKRPSGSFYCVSPWEVDRFPDPCNEGDFMLAGGAALAPVTVLSEYPAGFDGEVARRRRLARDSSAIGVVRVHDDPGFLENELRNRAVLTRLDPVRYAASVRLWNDVRRAAAPGS